MASTSWNDDESALEMPTPQAPAKRSGRVLRQIWWTSVPIWSLGFLSFVPFLAFAVIERRKRDWAVFAGYLAATVALVATLALVNANSDAEAAAGGLFMTVLVGCAAIHACILFRPGRARLSLEAARRRNQEAVVGARSRIEHRNDARRIFQTNLALARELRIGRPDLPREYDDGGLVDVNRVPSAVLTAQLGLTPQEVTNVIAARDKLGKFDSADELRDHAELPPGRVDELRDLMIFS
jgi:DNA uptake protein ComE-like DNA-binding protein